jgi:hypothetical protein
MVAASAGSAAPSEGVPSATDAKPLLGVNFIQYRFHPPYCWGNHILLDYHLPGVREEVVLALHAMRASVPPA